MFSQNVIFSMLVMLAIVLGPTYGIWKLARRYPPIFEKQGVRTGVSGPLLVFIAGQMAVLVRLLVQAAWIAKELSGMATGLINAVIVAGPTFFSLGLGLFILYALTCLRTPAAIALVIVALWLMGPVGALLQSWFFMTPLPTLALYEMFAWAGIWTVYFALSPRIALTYGTRRGARFVAQD